MIKHKVHFTLGDDFGGPYKKMTIYVQTPYASNDMEKRIKHNVDEIISGMEHLYKEWLIENQIDYNFKVIILENEEKYTITMNSVIEFKNESGAMAFKLWQS